MASKPQVNEEEKKVRGKSGPKVRFFITPEIIEEVGVLAGRGLTNQQIHHYYGIGHAKWYQLVKQYPELDAQIRKGKAKTISYVSGKLMELVKKGNLGAIIFYLKTQARFSEGNTIADEDPEKGKPSLSLTVNDPVEAAKIYQQIMGAN